MQTVAFQMIKHNKQHNIIKQTKHNIFKHIIYTYLYIYPICICIYIIKQQQHTHTHIHIKHNHILKQTNKQS